MPESSATFRDLSALLVGAPSVDESTAERHLGSLVARFGEAAIEELLVHFTTLQSQEGDLDEAIATQIVKDAEFGPIVKSILSLWFAGVVDLAAVPTVPPTGPDYTGALMWTAVGAHAPGFSDGYYGHWRYPPDTGV